METTAITLLTLASTFLLEAVSAPVTQKQLAQFVAARQTQQRQFAYDRQPQSQLYEDGGTQETADLDRPLPQQVYYGQQQQQQTRSLQRVPSNANQQLPEDYDPNPQYQFSFDIKDDESTNYHNRKETRDGDKISGSYSVVDSDGYIRTVTYTADPREGFKADVNRQPTDIVVKLPKHPTPGIAQQYQQLSPARMQLARKQQTLQYLQASSPIQSQEYTSKLQQPEQVYIQPQPIHLTPTSHRLPSAAATPKSTKVQYPQVYQSDAAAQRLVLGLYGNAYQQ